MRTRHFFPNLIFSGLVIVLGACAQAPPTVAPATEGRGGEDIPASGATNTPFGPHPEDTQTPGIPVTGELGTVTREYDTVEKGPDAGALLPVANSEALRMGESLRVTRGGAALLKFTKQLQVRLFNNSELGLASEFAGEAGILFSAYLQRGGVTGDLKEVGGVAELNTPTGVRIKVYGTQFFVVFDEGRNLTVVGNFDGRVEVEADGTPAELRAGYYIDLPAGEAPGEQVPIPVDRAQFERWALDNASPLIAVDLMREEVQPPPTERVAPSLTPVPQPPTAEVLQNAFCRSGPGTVYDAITAFETGARLAIDGRDQGSSWWRVVIPGSAASCWIAGSLLELSGNLDSVPVLPAPPTPTPSPTPTVTPSITPTFTETVYVDVNPPQVQITGVDPQQPCYHTDYGYTDDVTVIATAGDDEGVANVSLIWSAASGQGSLFMERVDDLTFSATITPPNFAGNMLIEVTAYDFSGNSSSPDTTEIVIVSCTDIK